MSDAYVYTPYVLKHDGSVVHHGQVQAAIDSLGRWTAQVVNLIAAGGTAPIGTAGGGLSGTYPSPTVVKAAGDFAVTGDFSVSGKARVPLVAYTAFSGTGGTTLNAAALAGSNTVYVVRTGATALFTDTTDVAGNLINAFPGGAPVGFAWSVIYQNNSSFNATLVGGSGVTISGQAVTAASSVTEYVFKVTGTGLITAYSTRAGAVA